MQIGFSRPPLCRGERIVYELALQELQVVYNGFGGASTQFG